MESSLSPDQFGLPELVLSAVMESMEEPVWTTWSRMKDWISASVSESGVVEVNGSAQGGGILYPTYPKSLLSYPYAVPEDSVFILGDCRTQAEDSRDFGPVQCSAVKAKVITLIRRRGL